MTTTKRTIPTFHRGDVVLVLFPNSNLQSAKRRPGVIVQADDLRTGLPQVIVAMITSRMDRASHASRVAIRLGETAGQSSGLLNDSVVMTDNLATVFVSAIDRSIGSLPMTAVDEALRRTLNL